MKETKPVGQQRKATRGVLACAWKEKVVVPAASTVAAGAGAGGGVGMSDATSFESRAAKGVEYLNERRSKERELRGISCTDLSESVKARLLELTRIATVANLHQTFL